MRTIITKISFILLLFMVGCQNNGNHPVPNVAVNVQVNIFLPSYSSLQSVGGYAFVNGGVKGIVIYRRSIDEFVAFDRMSTAEGGFDCVPLEIDTNNFLFLIDACSNAVYSMIDGTIISGDARYALRNYQATFDGFSILNIYN